MEFSKNKIKLIIMVFSFLHSCTNFKNENEERQVYSTYNFPEIEKVLVEYQDPNKNYPILESNQIRKIQKFFLDTLNYFPDKQLIFDGEKSKLSIKMINNQDTLNLDIYPTRYSNIIELGFLDEFDPNDKWKFRKFNRFYMSDKLLLLLKE